MYRQADKCPRCKSTLRIESCEEYELESRPEISMPAVPSDDTYEKPHESPYNHSAYGKKKKDSRADENKGEYDEPKVPVAQPKNTVPEKKSNEGIFTRNAGDVKSYAAARGDTFISGRVSQYSSTGKEDGSYRRLFPVKLYQAVVYRQRLEDVLHRFTVRVVTGKDSLGYEDYTDIPVNVHGTIAGGLQITDNSEVEVRGRFCDGVLMAYDIRMINNGSRSKVGFQRNIRAITIGIVAAILFAGVCYFGSTSVVGFGDSVKTLLASWLISFIVLTVLYIIFAFTKVGLMMSMFRGERRKFPFLTIAVVSFALAFFISRLIGM